MVIVKIKQNNLSTKRGENLAGKHFKKKSSKNTYFN